MNSFRNFVLEYSSDGSSFEAAASSTFALYKFLREQHSFLVACIDKCCELLRPVAADMEEGDATGSPPEYSNGLLLRELNRSSPVLDVDRTLEANFADRVQHSYMSKIVPTILYNEYFIIVHFYSINFRNRTD